MDITAEQFDDLKYSALFKSKLINDQIQQCIVNSSVNKVITPKNEDVMVIKKQESDDCTFNGSAVKKILMELKNERYQDVQIQIDSHINKFKNFEKQQEYNRKQQWLMQQRMFIANVEEQESIIFQTVEQHNKEISNQYQKLDQYYQKLAELKYKNLQDLQTQEKNLDKIRDNQLEFRLITQEIVNLLKSAGNNEIIKHAVFSYMEQFRSLLSSMEEIVASCRTEKASDEHVRKSEELVNLLKNIKDKMHETIKNIVLEEQNEKIKSKQVKEAEIVTTTNLTINKTNEQNVNSNVNKERTVSSVAEINKYISKNNLKIYSVLQEFCKSYEASYKSLIEDISCKKFTYECQKGINIPVNAISDANSQHLLDKYNRLKNLLAGKTVIAGDTQINASKHPLGINYSTNLLAMKFVKQSDFLVSNNPKTAFCYAAIIVALWNDYPDFGKLLLAHFYNQCPYLVPWYIPRAVDQTDEEHYKSQGYLYVDGVIEQQDKFLKRMTGIVRLYAAILITKPKRSQTKNHPHGLSHAWRWLSSILNLEPRYDITATVLREFLDVAGSTMETAYGKVFKKLMIFLSDKYLPNLNKIDTGGPASRLNVLMQEYKKDNRFKEPLDILPDNFW